MYVGTWLHLRTSGKIAPDVAGQGPKKIPLPHLVITRDPPMGLWVKTLSNMIREPPLHSRHRSSRCKRYAKAPWSTCQVDQLPHPHRSSPEIKPHCGMANPNASYSPFGKNGIKSLKAFMAGFDALVSRSTLLECSSRPRLKLYGQGTTDDVSSRSFQGID